MNLCPLGRSCAELGWDSAYHGSSQVCGRSEGDASVLGARRGRIPRCDGTANVWTVVGPTFLSFLKDLHTKIGWMKDESNNNKHLKF